MFRHRDGEIELISALDDVVLIARVSSEAYKKMYNLENNGEIKIDFTCEIDGYDSWGSIKYVREYTVENGFEAHPEKLREFDTPAVKLGGWDCFFKTAITWQMQAKMVSMMLELNDFMLERYFKA